MVWNQKARVQDDHFKSIQENCIKLELVSRDKESLLEEMVQLLNASGQIRDYDDCLQAVKEREASMSTGMQHGIAIPHGKSDGVDNLVVAIGLKKEGIDFNSLDGQESRIFIMTLSPKHAAGPHIQFLSSISAILNKPGFTEELLNSTSPGQVKDFLIKAAKESK